MDCATSATVTGASKRFSEPSGRRMVGIASLISTNKKARSSRAWEGTKRAQQRNRIVRVRNSMAKLLDDRPAAAGSMTSPHIEIRQFPEETGRRDWTRTNDPHHVKVVL